MHDRLSGVVTFVQAAEAGSFALAAQRMGLSRSAVGKSIARLEEQLGVRLFHRTTRSQSLTDDGQGFYERCARALAELEAAEAALDSGRRAPSGKLRVSVPALFGRRCVAPILLDLARHHPQLELEVSLTDRVIDLVEDGIDLAVRVGPLASSAGLMSRRLGTQVMVVCAAPSYLAERGTPTTLADLDLHQNIAYGRDSGIVQWRFADAGGRERTTAIKSRIRFDDLEVIADATLAGAGIAWLPCWLVADRLREGTLVRVLAREKGLGCDIHAVWPQTRHLTSKVRTAIDALAARVPALLAATAC
ncbi:LysR family transcriptional regulator [Chondromyces apiculatus]|uniref:Transcriptional regulator, LysR family n=1 Tax=Chondromyces apiculatus DSM 436 TaxID=1192034 RepID=A0A017TBE3_9BACT|nr:LysR family transcriptional regulator [Chondromyces apiculatus]EYF06140.1 transcriptional regulator, LysR family [Chondromyces apiculatus DSM 436]